jgi:prepilin-type N-terminal cleavage/methylation domain-containing protein
MKNLNSPQVNKQQAGRRAFTLIELLTVIAIIAILAAILIPAVGKVRERSAAAKTASNFRQVYTAHILYSSDNKGKILSAESTDAQEKMGWSKVPNFMEVLYGLGYLDSSKGGGCYVAELFDYHQGEGYELNENLGALRNIGQNRFLGWSNNALGVKVHAGLMDPAKTFFLTEGVIQPNGNWYWSTIGQFAGNLALPESYADGQRYIMYADGHLDREQQANLPVTAWDGGFTTSNVFWLGKYN